VTCGVAIIARRSAVTRLQAARGARGSSLVAEVAAGAGLTDDEVTATPK